MNISDIINTTDIIDTTVIIDTTNIIYTTEANEWFEDFADIFYPCAVIISIIPLVITLLIHLLSNTVNTSEIFIKMIVCFILNVITCYTVILVAQSVFSRESVWGRWGDGKSEGCEITGYIIQYCFLSVMFWINALGFNIWKEFTQSRLSSSLVIRRTKKEELYKFFKIFSYSHGMPLVICSITAIIDSSRPLRSIPILYYPNMGTVRCFLGEVSGSSYLNSGVFLYSDVFCVLVITTNMYFLCSNTMVLRRGWKNQAELLHYTGNQNEFMERFRMWRNQAIVFIKLMVLCGIPWLLKIVTSALNIEDDSNRKTFLSICLMVFSGFLIFFTLVDKNKVKGLAWMVTSAGMPDTPGSFGTNESTH